MRTRKSIWVETELLERARSALGSKTYTDTIAQALKCAVEGEEMVVLLMEESGAFPDWADPYHEA